MSYTRPSSLAALLALALVAAAGPAQGALLHRWAFDETGTTALNTGATSTYGLTLRNTSDGDFDIHSADGLGVAGLGRALDLSSNPLAGGPGARAVNFDALPGVPFGGFTITGWFKSDGLATLPTNVFLIRQENAFRINMTSSNRLQLNFQSRGDVNTINNAVTAANEWTFFAVTWAGTAAVPPGSPSGAPNGYVRWFVGSETSAAVDVSRGVSDTSNSFTLAMPTPAATSDFFIGRSNSTSGAFDGWIDDVRIYDTALTFDQIEEIRTSAVPEPGAGWIALGALACGRLRSVMRALRGK